jgi:hypothetical protein
MINHTLSDIDPTLFAVTDSFHLLVQHSLTNSKAGVAHGYQTVVADEFCHRHTVV